jgi:hypothetical protein
MCKLYAVGFELICDLSGTVGCHADNTSENGHNELQYWQKIGSVLPDGIPLGMVNDLSLLEGNDRDMYSPVRPDSPEEHAEVEAENTDIKNGLICDKGSYTHYKQHDILQLDTF